MEVGLLERHPAAAEGDRRDGVAVDHAKKSKILSLKYWMCWRSNSACMAAPYSRP